jgi:hypothetical protein
MIFVDEGCHGIDNLSLLYCSMLSVFIHVVPCIYTAPLVGYFLKTTDIAKKIA